MIQLRTFGLIYCLYVLKSNFIQEANSDDLLKPNLPEKKSEELLSTALKSTIHHHGREGEVPIVKNTTLDESKKILDINSKTFEDVSYNSNHSKIVPRKQAIYHNITDDSMNTTYAQLKSPNLKTPENISTHNNMSIFTDKPHPTKPHILYGLDEVFPPSHLLQSSSKLKQVNKTNNSSAMKTTIEMPKLLEIKKSENERTSSFPISYLNKFTQSPGLVVPIVITVIVVPVFGAIGYLAIRRGREAWKNRHYRRMDFLIDGMYND